MSNTTDVNNRISIIADELEAGVVKTKVSLGEKRRITELVWKKRGILNRRGTKERENTVIAPVLVVNSPEQKAIIDRIAALP